MYSFHSNGIGLVPNRATFENSQPISYRMLLYCCSCIRQQTSVATNAAIAAQIMARVLVLEGTTGLAVLLSGNTRL